MKPIVKFLWFCCLAGLVVAVWEFSRGKQNLSAVLEFKTDKSIITAKPITEKSKKDEVLTTIKEVKNAKEVGESLDNQHVIEKLDIENEKQDSKETDTKLDIELYASPGSNAYYALDSVKAALREDTKNTAKEIMVALQKYSNINVPEKRNITRAIMAYLPSHMDGFAKEVKALYLSIAFMRLYQPENIKTDFIVFTPAEGMEYPESFGCVQETRNSFDDIERCIVLEHIPTLKRPKLDDGASDPLKAYANYLDSMLILAEFKLQSSYDYLMRVDLDTFLTPGYGDWIPPKLSTIVVGRGGYGSNNANAHLKWITTKKLELNDTGLLGLGSTWYGASELMVATAKTTISIMRWLHTQEFSEYEKCCNGVDGWPHWHWPVILLYGGHIALNQLGPQNIQISETNKAEMDSGSTNTETLRNSVKHIHCWHTEDMFSKFAFQRGDYSKTILNDYIGMHSARDYVTVIAISSERLTNDELKSYTSDRNAMKENKWIRPLPIK